MCPDFLQYKHNPSFIQRSCSSPVNFLFLPSLPARGLGFGLFLLLDFFLKKEELLWLADELGLETD
jgi:hypothetical protein